MSPDMEKKNAIGIFHKSQNAKEVLCGLMWREDRDISKAVIFYVHRGAPNDAMKLSGSEILKLESSFFSTSESYIPYHRVFRIDYSGKTIFERPGTPARPARQLKQKPRRRR
jgi:uncharacterized protein (UPF0248 family)